MQIAGEQPIEELFGDVTVDRLRAAMGGALAIARVPRPRLPQAGDPSLRLLRRVDVVDPTSLDAYRARRRLRRACGAPSRSARKASCAR